MERARRKRAQRQPSTRIRASSQRSPSLRSTRGACCFAAEIGSQLQHLSKWTITHLAPNRLSDGRSVARYLAKQIIGLEQQGGLMRFRNLCTSAIVAVA